MSRSPVPPTPWTVEPRKRYPAEQTAAPPPITPWMNLRRETAFGVFPRILRFGWSDILRPAYVLGSTSSYKVAQAECATDGVTYGEKHSATSTKCIRLSDDALTFKN